MATSTSTASPTIPWCHVAKQLRIQDTLVHGLNSHSSNWPTQIQSHALSLLRSGEVTTYPELLRRILDDVREASSKSKATTNGDAGAKKVNGSSSSGSLAVPQSVIDDALKVTRESLEAVCEIDDHGGAS